MHSDKDTLFLCNFDFQLNDSDSIVENIKKLWSGHWLIEDSELLKKVISDGMETDTLGKHLKNGHYDSNTLEKVLQMAISAFLTFCDQNWNPHPDEFHLKQYFGIDWPEDVDVTTYLQRDSEPLYTNILYPELLYLSSNIFAALFSHDQSLLNLWWCFRSKVTHQRALEDTSATLYNELELLIAKLCNESQALENNRLKILLYLEIAQAYLMYGRVQKVDEYLIKARELAGLKLELTGILGKRTKFQQDAKAQLALFSKLDEDLERPSAEQSHGSSNLPPEIELQDDVRLNKIQFNENILQAELPSLEQTLCLLTVQYLQKSQPKDDLMTEELQPYIETVLSQKKGPWSTRVAALLIRCKLEANHKRTVERAMMQCETIVNDKSRVSNTSRLSYLWATGLSPAWNWKQQLADLYLSLGLVKAALEEYLKLQLWEDVIVCYTMLQLRHKAAEVIQQQIDIKPTVKLFCLLGDATDDVSCYAKAWEFSNFRSSRAQRHWGNYLFDHKKYGDCISHYEKSVEINSIQESVWLRLGFAALEMEKWELSAKAYRMYTYLQPNTFEAWNNLAKVYVKQGDKNRAYRALMEALRFNYDNWKLWENVIIVSMDTGHFEDVLRGCHRILDIKSKFEDIDVLSLLAKVIVEDKQDADGNSAARLRKRALELFGRITSIHQNKPEIWQLYADISPTYLLKGQRLLKAYKGFTLNGNWSNSPETCMKVLQLTELLLEYSLKARKEAEDKDVLQANQQLSSARLTGQAVIRAAEKQDWPETQAQLPVLKELLNDVTEYMKSIMFFKMATANDDEVLEGFLCPICKADLKSANQLTSHFESLHQEEQDVLKSLKDIFGKAKKIILNTDDTDLKETFDRALKLNSQDYYPFEEQTIGVSRSSTDYFRAVRSARLERYATETNKLLIRLDKLVCNMPSEPSQRKLHEQEVVPWLDGSSVKLCPNCAKAFNLTRRKHHCRLCGSILCHDCSVFLDLNIAKAIVDPSRPQTSQAEELNEKNGLRLCEHCSYLIELRKQVQENRNAKTVLMTAYEQMRSLMDQAKPAVAMYEKMCQSLFDGETTYNLADVNAMRGRIGKLAEGIDLLSKQIAAFPVEPATRQAKLQTAIRQAASHYIKEDLLSLRKLPTEAQIDEVRRQRYERAQKQIQMERERTERERQRRGGEAETSGSRVEGPAHDDDNPLLEQMNIIRGYIKEARKELRFEEVAILETNLKELKKEYQFQMLSNKS
nr:tetratricopeptide repeat protein 27-like [Vanessa tameamea]